MVKREKSPDIPDDAKYLVVHRPYPLNANFELPGDYIAFALWAASVLGTPIPILGLHHKPKARSTVILEVARETRLDGMLGEHRWNEVLKDPREEEKERVSQVFYSIYRTTRDAQKDGWKRVHVEEHWFVDKGWNLTTGPFKYPYPETHWCPPLAEDPTNKNIARPLPVAVKPPPPKSPSLVPGSSEWVSASEVRKSVPGSAGWAAASEPGSRGKARASKGRPAQRAPIGAAAHSAIASASNPWYRMMGAPPELDCQDLNEPEGVYEETTAQAAGPVNLWAEPSTKQEEGEPVALCAVHGKLCKKGICAERRRRRK